MAMLVPTLRMLLPIFNKGGQVNISLSLSLSLSLLTTGGSVWEVVFRSVISLSLSLFFIFFFPVFNKEKDGKTNKKERVCER